MRRWKRAAEGGITIYCALAMAALLPLVLGAIVSVKVSAGRMQAANSVDQAMFSLFAHYDRQLARDYGLYFLNAGSGGSDVDLYSVVSFIEEAMDYVLNPKKGRLLAGGQNLLHLERESCAVTSYTLATDAGGIPFEAQASLAMQQTAVIESISALREKLSTRERTEQQGQAILDGLEDADYGDVEAAAEAAAEERAEEGAEEGAEEEERPEVPEGFVNPLPVLYGLYRQKVMDLVVPGPVSQQTVDKSTLVTGRRLSTGLGTIDATGAAAGFDNLYYMAWIIDHFSTYVEPAADGGLAYEMEYLLKGKASDAENLKAVVGDLMKARQAINMLCLATDEEKGTELSLLSFFIASAMGIPPLEPIIKTVFTALWSYAESLVDVRALLEGKKVALVKDKESWQTDPEDLAENGGDIAALTRDIPGGTSYSEYLGTFIYALHRYTLTPRAMDMVELRVRLSGREDFRLDACINSLETETEIRAERRVTFPVTKELSYADL